MTSKQVLVIAAHPDDELLGCGGTVALHSKAGHSVTSLIVCEGESLRYGENKVDQQSHMQDAALILGVNKLHSLRYADQKLDTLSLTEIITPIEQVVNEVKPNIVYTQFGGDINRDHELLFKAVLVATRPMEKYIDAIYAFETASSTEWAYPRSFIPDTWVDISSTIQQKLDAMACYKTEVRPYPHPRSIESLNHRAATWGNQCCMNHAEVFMTIRRTLRNEKTPF